MRKNWLVAGILLPFFAVFFAFQIAPLIWILVNSFYSQTEEAWGLANYIANRLKNDYILCPDMRQRSIAGCYQNNVAWLYRYPFFAVLSSGDPFFTGYLVLVQLLWRHYRPDWRLLVAPTGDGAFATLRVVLCQYDQQLCGCSAGLCLRDYGGAERFFLPYC